MRILVKDKEEFNNPLKGWQILSAIFKMVFHTVHLADSVIELLCPFVCVSVCAIGLREVLPPQKKIYLRKPRKRQDLIKKNKERKIKQNTEIRKRKQ